MTFDPSSVEVLGVTLSKDHCVQVPWKYIIVCGYSDLFCKKTWTEGHWPLDDLWPHICWGHMCGLYPRIIVSKSHENTSKYVDTVNLFAKTWTKGHWPLDWPLTPHLLRSHVWLTPRIIVSKSHGNTSMYVDTVIKFANYHIHILQLPHTYTYCILRTESVITVSSELRSGETKTWEVVFGLPQIPSAVYVG